MFGIVDLGAGYNEYSIMSLAFSRKSDMANMGYNHWSWHLEIGSALDCLYTRNKTKCPSVPLK